MKEAQSMTNTQRRIDDIVPAVVPAVFDWPTNADLIADVARLGYLDGWVWDATYGRGGWWTTWRPDDLFASDIDPILSPVGYGVDFTAPAPSLTGFDAICLDGPYKLNGTPDPAIDERYGVHVVRTWQDRLALIEVGIVTLAPRLSPGGYLLVKCQDQVSSDKVRWQTDVFTRCAELVGMTKVDRFDMTGHVRPQPAGRDQHHAHGRPSTLLVFQR
jgi:hypothetical protein